MKRFYLIIALLPITIGLMAQNKAQSKPGSLNIVKEVKPAILEIVPGSVQFVDATGNNAIDAQEQCKLVFDVKNSGLGDGYGCAVKVTTNGTTAGITCSGKKLNTILTNSTQRVEIPISSSMYTADGRMNLIFQVDEPNGFGTDPQEITIATRAFVAPKLQVTDYTITGTSSAVLEKKKPFDLQVLLQNTQYGTAENVRVTISVPQNVYLLGGSELTNIAQMEAGQTKSLEYSLIANNNYTGSSIPVKIHIQEKHGKYAEDRTIDLAFNQTFASAKISVNEVKQERQEIQLATLTSDVDKNIPQNPRTNKNTFAFIIANERYQNSNFAQVPFAQNDGDIFRKYCGQTLGIPESNIHFHANATYAQMRSLITQLKTTAAVNENCNIILYYAGHGAPSEGTQEAYLIPVDAYQVDPQICLNLQTLYNDLKQLQDCRITVFLDACFSGANRDNTMFASARGVAITPKKNTVEGNLVVFSAATGNETAWPYEQEKHGMFTYFLLKMLQDTKGSATYADLHDYLYTNVRRESNNINHKLQTPTLNASANLQDSWKVWTLK